MVAEPNSPPPAPVSLSAPPPAPASVLTCGPTALRLAANARYVAEIALVEVGDAADRGSIRVVGESGEHTDRTADVADLAISAGLGLVKLLVPALGIGTGTAASGPDATGADAAGDQELVVTTRRQVHLIRLVPGAAEPRVVYLVLDRDRGTVAYARHVLRRLLVPGPPAGRPGGAAAAPVAPVIPLERHTPRRRTTSIRAVGRPVRRGADLRRTPQAWTHQALPEGARWSRDDATLQRLLAGLHAMA